MYHKLFTYIIVILNALFLKTDGYYGRSNSVQTKLVQSKISFIDSKMNYPEKENNYEEVKLIIPKFKSRHKYEDTLHGSSFKKIDVDKPEKRFIDYEDDDSSKESDKMEAPGASTTTESSFVDLLIGDNEDEDDDDAENEIKDYDDDENNNQDVKKDEDDLDLRQNRRKYTKVNKIIFPLLLAYKLKFFTMVPLLLGSLVLLVGTTGIAGFFFALFAAAMGLHVKSSH